MNIKSLLLCLSAMATFLAVTYAHAQSAPVQIHIEGRVEVSTCDVATDTLDLAVPLGTFPRFRLSSPNTSTDWESFTLNVTNCPPQLSTSTVKFIGTPAGSDNSLFMNTGDAQNVAVQIAKDASRDEIISNNSEMTVNIDATNNASFDLVARMYSETGLATAGSVNATVLLEFSYE